MIIPSSFQAAYSSEKAILEEVQEVASSRLAALCRKNQWLFAERIKSEESTLARLQLGDIHSLSEIVDFYGATVIVPTKNELEAATDAVVNLFDHAEIQKERNTDPRAFPYDDVHVRARLGASATRALDPVRARRFEVQVRTGLQYAWWWATHDVIYKAGAQEWSAHRLASQVRASLELLDDVLANLKKVSELQPDRTTEGEEEFKTTAALLTNWAVEQRPKDVRRFCESSLAYMRAADLTVDELVALVRNDANSDVIGIPGITPAQGVLIVVFRAHSERLVQGMTNDGRRIFASPEMVEACSELAELDADLLVATDSQ
jgi:ppGpp synthetase/RelA/SpoT-type nucleotidyltranferase